MNEENHEELISTMKNLVSQINTLDKTLTFLGYEVILWMEYTTISPRQLSVEIKKTM